MSKPPKLTRVSRALADEKTRDPPVGIPVAPAEVAMSSFVPRLGFRHGPRVPKADWDLPGFLAQATDHALFLDSSVLTRKIDYELWDELLRPPRRLFLIEKVVRELAEHFTAVPEHPLRKAIRARNPALVTYPEPPSGGLGQDALLYYLNLLTTRRFVLDRALARYAREHGIEPDAQARRAVETQIQRDFGERGLLLCKKPLSRYFTDEVLVYLAIAHAVETGQPTMILTGDHDVEEQFFKAVELITFHYFAMLVAREYRRDPARLRPHAIDVRAAQVEDLFDSATLLDLGGGNDGLVRYQGDGLIRYHSVRLAADDLALIERGSDDGRKWGPEWSCLSRSDGTGTVRTCQSGRWRRVIGSGAGRLGRRWCRRSRRRASGRRVVQPRSWVSTAS